MGCVNSATVTEVPSSVTQLGIFVVPTIDVKPVGDEAPLGPREEGDDITGENRFFDQDAERGTFRDVFRRRR